MPISSLLTIEPIDHWAYRPSSLSTIKPIHHRAYQPSSLSTIKPIDHRAYWPLSLLTVEPINHRAHWPSSLSTLALLSRLLSLSACLTSSTFQDFILCWCRIAVSSFYLLFCPSVIIAHQCVQPNVFYNGTQIKHHTNIQLAQTYVFKVINYTNIVKWPDIIDAKQLDKCKKKFDLFWTHGWQHELCYVESFSWK